MNMADEKKTAKSSGMISDSEATERIIGLLLLLVFLSLLLTGLLNYFNNLGTNDIWAKIMDYFLKNIWPWWKIVAVLVSILAILGIIYNSWKLRAINISENLIFNPGLGIVATDEGREVREPKNERWEKILEYLNSDNPSDWRQAIIEADVMLEELLRTLGYHGDSLGEMLKSAEKEDFLSIDDAWEAHKMRNTIAHAGGDFQLNERETRRIISLFENVFKEFNLV